MKDLPIIFSPPMVAAIAEGRKTMTRRILTRRNVTVLGERWGKNAPWEGLRFKEATIRARSPISGAVAPNLAVPFCHPKDEPMSSEDCGTYRIEPRVEAGDLLWVRELHRRLGRWRIESHDSEGKPVWCFSALPDRGPLFSRPITAPKERTELAWHMRPSIFLPRCYSRTTLMVQSVKFERLLDISDEDAIAEGCPGRLGPNPDFPDEYDPAPAEEFRMLWESIHGKGAWSLDPLVIAISFCDIAANVDVLRRNAA